MKYFYLVLTLSLLYLCLRVIKLLDNTAGVLIIIILTSLVGLLVKVNSKENKPLQNLGWGLLYGGLSAFLLIIVSIIWLAFNFPR